jgi:hypothetical protein
MTGDHQAAMRRGKQREARNKQVRKGKTNLNLGIGYLTAASSAAAAAGATRQARTLDRLIREANQVLQGWPAEQEAAER